MSPWILLLLCLGLASAAEPAPAVPAPAAPTPAAPTPAAEPEAPPSASPAPTAAPTDPTAPTEPAAPTDPTAPTEPAAAAPDPVEPAFRPGPAVPPDDPAFIGPSPELPPRLRFDGQGYDTLFSVDPFEADRAPSPPAAPPPAPAPAPAAPAPPSVVPVPTPAPAPTLDPTVLRGFLPRIVLRGFFWAFFLGVLAALAWMIARALAPLRDRLAPNGLLPSLVSGAQHVLRIAAVLLVLGVIAAILPKNLEPALPVVVLVAAAAVGWSWRDLLPDLVAGLVLAAERRILPGQWVSTPEGSGIVEQTTLRVTRIRDATGRQIALPNRALIRHAVVTDRGRWPTIEIELLVPGQNAPSTVRRVIEDAVLVSPWAAPVPAQMIREEQEPGRWRVRARILESRFADRFEGGLREHVEEVLESGSRLRS